MICESIPTVAPASSWLCFKHFDGMTDCVNNTELNHYPIKPLFRWVGGKQKLLTKLLPFVPKEYGTYFEPFFGGGALYFSLSPKRAVIGDKNPELVNFLTVVRENPGALIRALSKLENSEEAYYAVRASKPSGAIARAARFQYLINLGFSGVYRVNKNGEFNVPYSKEAERTFFDGSKIFAAHRMLKNASVFCGDFADTVKEAQKGDFVYFDPPYTVAHDNNGFLEYNESIFQWEEQEKLAALVKSLAQKGVFVLVSNANHNSVRELYDFHHIHYIDRKSTISASNNFRGKVKEVLVVYN